MPNVNPSAVSARDAASLLASGKAILIDVREPDEFKAEHIACAASMPLGSVAELFGDMQIPPDRKIIFQCQKGGRGDQACRLAGAAAPGHAIYNLPRGLSAWKQAGLPVTGVGGRRDDCDFPPGSNRSGTSGRRIRAGGFRGLSFRIRAGRIDRRDACVCRSHGLVRHGAGPRPHALDKA